MKKRFFVTFILILAILGGAFAQERTITGKVTSAADGQPLPGANVKAAGTSIGTITNAEGKYSIKVPAGTLNLEISFVGMKTQTIAIGQSTVLDFAMEVSTEALSEVVVTALGIQKQTKALGFAQQGLNSEELTANRETNISNYLTAKIAGVQVSHTASGTGGSTQVMIRGAKSLLGNNQPLYVVDGVPITNIGHSSGGQWGGADNDLGDGIGDINPEDVESMSVLKGPNASALYGSRGSNGVVLITTKSGHQKKGIGVELNSNLSFETINMVPTFQNSYASGYEETNIYGELYEIPPGSGKFYESMDTWQTDSYGPPLDGRRTIVDPFVYPKDANKKTLVLLPQPADNVKKFYQTGIDNTNTLAITGATEKTTARLSIGNSSTKGIIPNNTLNKQTITLRTSSQVTNFLSFDSKINYIRDEGNNRPALGSTSDNVAATFCYMGRYVPMSWLKEYYETTKLPGHWPQVAENPYFVVNELKNHDTKDRIIGYISATLKFNDWLSLMGRTGADYYTQKQDKRWPIGSFGSDNTTGRVFNLVSTVKDYNADAILTAAKELSSNFSVNASLGTSILYQARGTQQLDCRNFKAPGVYDVSNCKDIRPYDYLSRKEIQSVYFMGDLAFRNYLFLDITGRNDWSSALGINNYSYFYPSVSTSFVFTDAFKSIQSNILSFGKIRASWAQVGNDSDPYMTQNGYNSYTTTYAGQGLASMNSQIPLFNLKNELTESWEVGTDLRFFQNRLGFDVTYYNGKTTNQIVPVQISNASGYQTVVINAGEIQNKGLEAMVRATVLKTSFGFGWDITANYSRNHSKVISLAPGIESLTLEGSIYPNVIEARVGQPYGNIIGYAYSKAPDGQRIVNSAGSYEHDPNQTILGNITPKWIGGLNNTFSFKGLSISCLLDFVQGRQMTSATKYRETASGTGVWTTVGRRVRDMDDAGNQLPLVGILPGVVEIKDAGGNVTGYQKNTKAVDGQTYWATRAWSEIGEEFVLDGSYISLREVMLSYNFSPSFLKKTPFTGLTVTAVGRNLLYLEEHMQGMGISPESAPNTAAGDYGVEMRTMPTTRTWGLNLKLTF